MKNVFCAVGAIVLLCSAVATTGWAQPAASPEDAGITAVTGDITPWRPFGLANMNYDQTWALALPNGNLVALKRGADFSTPGVIGGTEFLILSPSGETLSPAPVHGAFQADGTPLPYIDFNAGAWGAFTVGAGVDKVNGTGFVVNNQAEFFQTHGLPHGDVLGDDAGSILQFFNADGSPNGSVIAPFGSLSSAEGSWRDIHSALLSNGNAVSVAENRQFTDELLDSVGAAVGEAAIAAIVSPQGEVVVPPFVVHVDENNQYIGGGSSSLVFGNVVAFDGGFVIDHGAGIRWYNNDGTPITPSQDDHAELVGEFIEPVPGLFFDLPANTNGRGDGRGMAANADTIVRAVNVTAEGTTIGVLIYYNTDGTVRNFVRFDDVDFISDDAQVDRISCDIDVNGNVFVAWQDNREIFNPDAPQIFARFISSEGEPFGPSFPVYENWDPTGERTSDYVTIGLWPDGDYEQPRAALNTQVGMVIDPTNILPDFPDATMQQLAAAFEGVAFLTEPVVRIFANPFFVDVESWELY